MKIHIASRLKPFSHRPGTQVMIPGGVCTAVIYPTCLQIIKNNESFCKLQFLVNEATRDFTVIQDLEKRCVRVIFRAKEGYFRYQIKHKGSKIVFVLERAPNQLGFDLHEGESCIRMSLRSKETLDFEVNESAFVEEALEKLSFGCHKKQDWQLVQSRNNPIEYLPFWFQLGQLIPPQEVSSDKGSLKYLSKATEFLKEHKKEGALERLSHVFKAGFKELLVPLLYDEKHHGVFEASIEENMLAPDLLSLGYKIIRDFFVKKDGSTLSILPNLPKEFHSGRLINIVEDGLCIDIEWSKKLLKKMKVKALKSQKVTLRFQRPLKSYRLKTLKKDCGKRLNVTELFDLEEGKTYFFDNFRK